MSAIPSVTRNTGYNAPDSAASGTEMGKKEFLQLLVLQLVNQDPLNPMDDREFLTQMAQLSSLEATTDMGSQVKSMVAMQQRTQALQMVGHNVTYTGEDGEEVTGKVSGVRLDTTPPTLVIGDKEIPYTSVLTVQGEDVPAEPPPTE